MVKKAKTPMGNEENVRSPRDIKVEFQTKIPETPSNKTAPQSSYLEGSINDSKVVARRSNLPPKTSTKVKEEPTPDGYGDTPGFGSTADQIPMSAR